MRPVGRYGPSHHEIPIEPPERRAPVAGAQVYGWPMSATAPDDRDAYLDLSKLSKLELVGMASGLLLLISLFLPWYGTSGHEDSFVGKVSGGDSATAWQTFGILDIALLALSFAPFILSWILARQHKLDWPTGEVTMVTGLIGIFLVICNGLILGKPGDGVEISLEIGWFLGLIGCVGIFVAGLLRQAERAGPRRRKPPGSV
jgi:hypothetical protein